MEGQRKKAQRKREKVLAVTQIQEQKQLQGLTALFLLSKQVWRDNFTYFLPLPSPEKGQTPHFKGRLSHKCPCQAPWVTLPIVKYLCQQSLPAPWAAAPGADKHESSSMAWQGTWGTGEALEEPHSFASSSTTLGSIPADKPQSPASTAVRSAGHPTSSSPCPETQPVLTRDIF